MEIWNKLFIVVFSAFGIWGSYLGYQKSKLGKDNLGLATPFFIYGAFVWADIVIFGVFWALFSITCLLLNDWLLFLLGYSLFWFVRSLGETVFWFNQQFSTIKRYTHKDFFFSKHFGNDNYTVWFVMQILMQCVAVVSAILSLYFGGKWLGNVL